MLRPTKSFRLLPLLLMSLIASAIGCGRPSETAAGVKHVKLVVSGDTAGWLMPCGCTANQSGGLLRRATYLKSMLNDADLLYVDVGGAAAGESDYQKVKFEAILVGEKKMKIYAHNIGRSEAAFGAEYLREVSARLQMPLVSANIQDRDGATVAPPMRIVNAGGRRVAIVGVLSPKFATAGMNVLDPRQAVLGAANSAKGTYDSLVVLAYVPQDELEELAAALPEADAVIGGPTGQAIAPRKVGPTLLAAATNKGKFLIELDAVGPAGAWNGRVVEMSPDYADDEQQKAGVETFLAALEQKNFPAAQTGLAPPVPAGAPLDYRVSGTESCLKCHSADNETWIHTKHAAAWETIRVKGFHVDAYCQQCHTTGFGLPGGFESRTKSIDRVSVGCEDCHGPSFAHAHGPATRTTFAAADQCTRCHDHENSPAFAYAAYWPRVQHGQSQRPTGAALGAPAESTGAR